MRYPIFLALTLATLAILRLNPPSYRAASPAGIGECYPFPGGKEGNGHARAD